MKTFITLLTATLVVMLAGCNTVKGMGQDMQKAGEKIENAATKK